MRKCPVVITGVGAATPLGSDFATFANNLLAGKSAARVVCRRASRGRSPSADLSGRGSTNSARLESRHGGNVVSLRNGLRPGGRVICALRMPVIATRAAGLRIGLVLGSGGELLRRWEGDWAAGGREVFDGEPIRRRLRRVSAGSCG